MAFMLYYLTLKLWTCFHVKPLNFFLIFSSFSFMFAMWECFRIVLLLLLVLNATVCAYFIRLHGNVFFWRCLRVYVCVFLFVKIYFHFVDEIIQVVNYLRNSFFIFLHSVCCLLLWGFINEPRAVSTKIILFFLCFPHTVWAKENNGENVGLISCWYFKKINITYSQQILKKKKKNSTKIRNVRQCT